MEKMDHECKKFLKGEEDSSLESLQLMSSLMDILDNIQYSCSKGRYTCVSLGSGGVSLHPTVDSSQQKLYTRWLMISLLIIQASKL